MAPTVADRVVERLIQWGVTTIFGLLGDGINAYLKRSELVRIGYDSCKYAMKNPQRSPPVHMPNLVGD